MLTLKCFDCGRELTALPFFPTDLMNPAHHRKEVTMMNWYFGIAVSGRLTYPAPLGKVPTNPPREIVGQIVFGCNRLQASAGNGFHVKLPAQNISFTGVFFMLDSVVMQEFRDQYNDLTQRVAELRRFL